MKRRLSLSLVVVLCIGGFAVAARQDQEGDNTKSDDIRRLIHVTGADKLGQQMVDQMMKSYPAMFPNVPPEIWSQLGRELKVADMEDSIVLVYDRHLSRDDVRELLRFYESPVGQRVIHELPQITQECMLIGQEWGRAKGELVMRRLMEKGYKPTAPARGDL